MKRQWIIACVVSLLLIVGGFVVAQCLWWLPQGKCSEVYRRYADSPDINAAYVKDFKVNDTVSVNVTTLEAKDSASWESLSRDINVPPPPILPDELKELFATSNSFGFFVIERDTVDVKGKQTIYKDICIFSRAERTVCLFHKVDEKQIHAILNKEVDDITF